ncbi:hypothetical protein KHC33_07370 [Methanospirillum sp. J.3.6.1-F.2.7.3]|uniref:Uncharacterized protein n=1 Tax=Methanospirillum purgamenti TaxID=2834276 RepID=A0A8E7AYS4_9EURY|nr:MULTISPECIES: hypothetical protein [Methanospirillum]MDX8550737.1 hypothetical protein [Methanospirillum hungatei]QVV90292.1 hypothetical protein KHC33_07370 [Methanospirillum sp. J.3.6.1-F.2.7.3]
MRFVQALLSLLFTFIIITCILPVQAVPPLPAEFYGNVLIDGTPAPAGTIITAFLQDVSKGSIATEIDGFYGGPGLFDPRLKVNVSEEEFQSGNLRISFQINGVPASQTVVYEPGTSQQFDLFTGGTSLGENIYAGQTPIPAQTQPPVNTMQPGENYTEPPRSEPSDSDPTIRYGLETEENFKSDDGMAKVTFEKDTLLFSPSGEFLQNVNISSRTIADLPPIDTNQSLSFSGYAYEIFPERTYFNPEGKISFQIPIEKISDLLALNPQIHKFNPQTATWDSVRTSSNQFTGEISGTIYEAAIYGLFIESQNAFASPTPTEINSVPATLPPIAGQPPATIQQQYPLPPAPPSAGIAYEPVYPSPESMMDQAQVGVTPEPTVQIEPVQTETLYGVEPVSTEPAIYSQEITQVPVQGPSPITAGPTMIDSLKKAMSSPVGLGVGLVLLILLINAIVYAIYTRWWLVRNP